MAIQMPMVYVPNYYATRVDRIVCPEEIPSLLQMPMEYVSSYYAAQVDRIVCPERYVPIPYIHPEDPHVRVYRMRDFDYVKDMDAFCVFVHDDFVFTKDTRFFRPSSM